MDLTGTNFDDDDIEFFLGNFAIELWKTYIGENDIRERLFKHITSSQSSSTDADKITTSLYQYFLENYLKDDKITIKADKLYLRHHSVEEDDYRNLTTNEEDYTYYGNDRDAVIGAFQAVLSGNNITDKKVRDSQIINTWTNLDNEQETYGPRILHDWEIQRAYANVWLTGLIEVVRGWITKSKIGHTHILTILGPAPEGKPSHYVSVILHNTGGGNISTYTLDSGRGKESDTWNDYDVNEAIATISKLEGVTSHEYFTGRPIQLKYLLSDGDTTTLVDDTYCQSWSFIIPLLVINPSFIGKIHEKLYDTEIQKETLVNFEHYVDGFTQTATRLTEIYETFISSPHSITDNYTFVCNYLNIITQKTKSIKHLTLWILYCSILAICDYFPTTFLTDDFDLSENILIIFNMLVNDKIKATSTINIKNLTKTLTGQDLPFSKLIRERVISDALITPL